MKEPATAGVYTIKNTVTCCVYVGVTQEALQARDADRFSVDAEKAS